MQGNRISIDTLELCMSGSFRNVTRYLTLMQGLSAFIKAQKLTIVERLKVESMIPKFLHENNDTCQLLMRINNTGLALTEIDQILQCIGKERISHERRPSVDS